MTPTKATKPTILIGALLLGFALPAGMNAAVPPAGRPVGQLERDPTPFTSTPTAKQTVAAAVAAVATGALKTGSLPLAESGPSQSIRLVPCEDEDNGCNPGAPPASKVLQTYARQQNNDWFCGPAAGQVAINWSRDYFFANTDGTNAATNWKKQGPIATSMGTTSTEGTYAGPLRNTLNDMVISPSSIWAYAWEATGTESGLHNKVVTDVHSFGMPLISLVRPNEPGKPYHLSSWTGPAVHAGHWILIRGYNGLYAGSASLYYNDSSGEQGGGTGAYVDTVTTMWRVNHYHSDGIIW